MCDNSVKMVSAKDVTAPCGGALTHPQCKGIKMTLSNRNLISVSALLYSSSDDVGVPLDDYVSPSDVHKPDIERLTSIVFGWIDEHEDDIDNLDMSEEEAARIMVLVASGHGVAFSDNFDHPSAERLDDSAESVGVFDLYRGDDMKWYLFHEGGGNHDTLCAIQYGAHCAETMGLAS